MIDRQVIGWLIGVPALLAFSFLVQWLLKLGGAPEKDGVVSVYRLKPMMRLTGWILAAGGAWLIWYGVKTWHENRLGALIVLGVAVVCLAAPVAMQSQVIVDQNGIRLRNLFRRESFISWPNLSHVERLTTHNPKAMIDTTTYFFRGTCGSSLAVDGNAFNAKKILLSVRQHHSCPERPPQSGQRDRRKT